MTVCDPGQQITSSSGDTLVVDRLKVNLDAICPASYSGREQPGVTRLAMIT